MKKVYWRPQAVSRIALVMIALFAVCGLVVVEKFPVLQKMPYQKEKKAATKLASEAFESIFFARRQTGVEIDRQADPTGSGLMGLPMSSITSLAGTLEDKQTTINPNFAAVIVDLLKQAGVEKGDVVAVGVSGSFPALNICTYAALQTLETKPIVIASAASSQWGANLPELMWLDMEGILEAEGILSIKSVAASIGGHADRGLRFPKEGKEVIDNAMKRNEVEFLDVQGFEESISKRMEVYEKLADGKKIAAYVNVGGGMVSVGREIGKKTFDSGLNEAMPKDADGLDGVMVRFAREKIPVIHLVKIQQMAEQYQMPLSPTSMPRIGESAAFERLQYNNILVLGTLLIELGLLFSFIRSDLGSRLFRRSSKHKKQAAPEPMV